MTKALARVRSGYRPSAGRATRRMNHNSPRPPTTPTTTPTLICRTNWPATPAGSPAVDAAGRQQRDHQRDADRVVRSGLALQDVAAPAGYFAAAQHGEDDRGIRGDTAVPSSAARYQSSPKPGAPTQPRRPRSGTCPAIPTTAIGAADRRKRDQPRCMPPSNRMHSSATVTTRSTSLFRRRCQALGTP